MAKRKAFGKTPARKTSARKEKSRVPEMSVAPSAPQPPNGPVDAPEDEQPPAGAAPAPRGRKKRAKPQEPPPHWRVAETGDEPGPVPEPEPIAHLAKCGQCAVAVRFTPLPSGHGITVVEASGVDLNTSFGL